jgi:hypothetical protein
VVKLQVIAEESKAELWIPSLTLQPPSSIIFRFEWTLAGRKSRRLFGWGSQRNLAEEREVIKRIEMHYFSIV